jgi:hypothetical protein
LDNGEWAWGVYAAAAALRNAAQNPLAPARVATLAKSYRQLFVNIGSGLSSSLLFRNVTDGGVMAVGRIQQVFFNATTATYHAETHIADTHASPDTPGQYTGPHRI